MPILEFRSSTFQTQLEHEPALQYSRITENSHHSGQESVEDQELSSPPEVDAATRCGLQALLQGLLESLG